MRVWGITAQPHRRTVSVQFGLNTVLKFVHEKSYKSRVYLGNDFENRWVFSRWWNVDSDSADVTSEGRSFHVAYNREGTVDDS